MFGAHAADGEKAGDDEENGGPPADCACDSMSITDVKSKRNAKFSNIVYSTCLL